MPNTDFESTFVTNTISAWLSSQNFKTSEASFKDTQKLLIEILFAMGHSKPNDAEQRSINTLLRLKRADAESCITAWEFYNDYYGHKVCLKNLALAA